MAAGALGLNVPEAVDQSHKTHGGVPMADTSIRRRVEVSRVLGVARLSL